MIEEKIVGGGIFMSWTLRGFLIAAAVGLVACPAASAADPAAPGSTINQSNKVHYAPGQLLVRFDSQATAEQRAKVRARHHATLARALPVPGLQLLKLKRGASVSQEVAALNRTDGVAYAQPNHVLKPAAIPNDTRFAELWSLNNTGQEWGEGVRVGAPGQLRYIARGLSDADVDAPEAWDMATGDANLVVADIDVGVKVDHPDIAPNLWTNAGETGSGKESNGVDDDGNGYADDWQGWNFVDDSNQQGPNGGHATHTSGTIAAVGNNARGITGINWQAKIMPLDVCDASGCSDAALASAFVYAGRMGARVANVSIGGYGSSPAMLDAVQQSPNTLFVAAAGNDAVNLDQSEVTPCELDAPNVMCVAATDYYDDLAYFSNYSQAGAVDLAAPGTWVLSGTYNFFNNANGYEFESGTSMATPHVTGAAALLWSVAPSATIAEVRQALIAGVDKRETLDRKTASNGRLNLARSLELLAAPSPTNVSVVGSRLIYRASAGESNHVTIAPSGTAFTVSDSSGSLQSGAGCSPVGPGAVACTTQSASTPVSISADAGDGNDTLSTQTVDVPVTMQGGTGADTLEGGQSNDSLEGGADADVLHGGPGDDLLDGQAGGDDLSGGPGLDMVSYAGRAKSVVVDIDLKLKDDGGTADRRDDTVRPDVENLQGGGGKDLLRGDDLDNMLLGGAGNDRIYGNGGDDTIDAGDGNDRVYAGAGDDRLTMFDYYRDYIFCQADNDTVTTNGYTTEDIVNASCENVERLQARGTNPYYPDT